MKVPILAPGLQAVAIKIQESMMQSDVRRRLDDAIRDLHRGTDTYGYYVDHAGDDTGDVIYSCNGDLRKCGYSISDAGGKAVVTLDSENSVDVVPVTTYQEEADEADHYASMESALKAGNIYTDLPLYERFISKDERAAAGADDFAGKGKSFPILKPEDVTAAAHAMGRAGSGNLGPSGIKARIIAIAKRKGWTSHLPKAWQGDSPKESATPEIKNPDSGVPRGTPGKEQVRLVESAATLETIVLREAKADYEIKLIAPGKGSSAFYPAEVLKRDGPKVFGAGTHVYLNHATAAEESQRPEGDVKNLAGVLTTAAAYNESHAKGPGLYARMKVFADHAQVVEEKAAHVGMSIRASGVAESGKSKDGLPVLKELTSAESVDVVTRAGAGGMILTESAHRAGEGDGMTQDEAKALIESAVAPFRARALRGDAREEAQRLLETATLPQETKARIIETVMRDVPMKDGEIDLTKFREAVVAETKREGEYLARMIGSGAVRGLGISLVPPQDPAKLKEAREAEVQTEKDLREAELKTFGRLLGSADAAKRVVEREEVA